MTVDTQFSTQGLNYLGRGLPPPFPLHELRTTVLAASLHVSVAVVSVLGVYSEGSLDTARITPRKVSFNNRTWHMVGARL